MHRQRSFVRFAATALLAGGIAAVCLLPGGSASAEDKPAEAPAAAAPAKNGKFPHVEFNVEKRQVRVECESLAVDAPLEFFVCLAGTAEHEAVMRTSAKPSHIHTALLACGLKPGQPMTFLDATKKWLPPQGPPLQMTVEYEKDGKTVSYPAYRWLRDIKTKKEPKAFTWIFAGSRITPDGRYGADDTGYVVTLVNFDYAMIDIPQLASSSNDLLEFERNADLMPPKGSKVTLVIEPTGKAAAGDAGKADPAKADSGKADPAKPTDPSEKPAEPAKDPSATATPAGGPPGLSELQIDEQKVQSMIDYHKKVLAPREQALKEAAEAHYKVIAELRKEQQRLITEADRIQRAIDELERQWSDAVTPRPEFNDNPIEPPPFSQ